MTKLSNKTALIISAISGITFSWGLAGILVFIVGSIFGGPSSLFVGTLWFLGSLLLVVVPLLIPALVGGEKWKNYGVFFLVFVLWTGTTTITHNIRQSQELERGYQRNAVQTEKLDNWRGMLLGSWNVEYRGENIEIRFQNDDARTDAKGRNYIINASFFRNNSETPFEEGDFYISTDEPFDSFNLAIRSSVPVEIASGLAPSLPYFQLSGLVDSLTSDHFILSDIASLDPRVPLELKELEFVKVR